MSASASLAPLVVEPFGGLGNRMRAVASAYVLASQAGRPLDVIWIKKSNLNAAFGDLFEPASRFRVIADPGRYQWVRRSHQPSVLGRAAASVANRRAGVSCCIVENDFPRIWRGEIDLVTLARTEPRLYVATFSERPCGSGIDFGSWS